MKNSSLIDPISLSSSSAMTAEKLSRKKSMSIMAKKKLDRTFSADLTTVIALKAAWISMMSSFNVSGLDSIF